MSVGRSSKDQYSFQSLTSPHTGGKQLTANQKRLQPTDTEKLEKITCPEMNDSGWAFFMRTWNLVLQTALTGVVYLLFFKHIFGVTNINARHGYYILKYFALVKKYAYIYLI